MAIRGLATTYDDFTAIDTVKRHALGFRVSTGDASFVYVQGVTSGAAGKFVTFTSAGVTTLLAADAVGMVGVLMSTLDATTKYGFAQVFGVNAIAATDTVAANTVAYIDGTAGRVDDVDVAGDVVINCLILTADTSNVASVWLNYPYVGNVAID